MNVLNHIDEYTTKKQRWLGAIADALDEHEKGWEIRSVYPNLITDLAVLVRPGVFYSPKMVNPDDYANETAWLEISHSLLELHRQWTKHHPDEPIFNEHVVEGLFHLQGLACVFDWDDKTANVVNASSKTKMEWTKVKVLPTLPSSADAFYPGSDYNDIPDFGWEWIEIVDEIIHRHRPVYNLGNVQIGGHIHFIQDGDEQTALGVYDTEHGDCGQAYVCVEKNEITQKWSLDSFDQMC